MSVDKFRRMSDAKTRDTGVSLTYINNNYIHSDGDTPVSGSIDMKGNTLYNVLDPVNLQDVATKEYVDGRTHMIAVHPSYHGNLIKGEYQFMFGGTNVKSYTKHDIYNSFLMPWNGRIKHLVTGNTGFKLSSDTYDNPIDFAGSFRIGLIPIFTLVVVKKDGKIIDLGTLFARFRFYGGNLDVEYELKSVTHDGAVKYKINAGDVINIRSEINTIVDEDPFKFTGSGTTKGYDINDFDNEFFTYLITILIELDPLSI